MIDIVSANAQGLGVAETDTFRAANIFSIQIGDLEYAPEFGIDLRYFLSEDFRFQNDSFKSYLIQILANYGINVADVIDTVEALFEQYTFNLVPPETAGGLVAR